VLLNNIRKTHLEKSLEYFPESNKTLVRKSFIINHTPGTIEYDIQGFRDKNKDFVR
jgi:myosin heavy subunit